VNRRLASGAAVIPTGALSGVRPVVNSVIWPSGSPAPVGAAVQSKAAEAGATAARPRFRTRPRFASSRGEDSAALSSLEGDTRGFAVPGFLSDAVVAQLILEHAADRVTRQIVAELDVTRHREVRDALDAPFTQLDFGD
jgi:hypothetical protein